MADLWDEVRKAFRVTAFVEDRAMVLFDVDRWTRTLDPEHLTVQEEQRRPRTGLHPASPFVSRPPQELAEDGYVRGERGDDESRYYGPDAHVLLDRSFEDAHCFGLTGKAPDKSWLGLQFQPRDSRKRDIEGTLWIDRETYAPRRLDYRYTRLPWRLDTDKVGGRVEFTRIPEGPWVVNRWWIRMPVVQDLPVNAASGPEVRYGLAALIEEGGEVRRARTDDQHVVTFAMGTIDGVVMDSLGSGPVQGARVGVVGTFFQATTGPHGRFRFTDVPQGHYVVSASSEDLAVVSPELRTVEADVVVGEMTGVELDLPSAAAVARSSCAEPLTPDGPGVIVGTLRTLDGAVVAGASVQVSWDVVRGGAVGLSQTTQQGTVSTRADGTFTVCGIPKDEALRVEGVAPAFAGEPIEMRFEDDTFRMLDLVLAPGERTTVTLQLADSAFEVDPITVQVSTPEKIAQKANGSSGTIQIGQPTIQRMERERGANSVTEVIRRALPGGVRTSPLLRGPNYVGTCIESSRGNVHYRKAGAGGARHCAMVQVVVDGGYLTDEEGARLVDSFPLSEIVSMEFLSPMEQTFRYGTAAGNGMLIINTARR